MAAFIVGPGAKPETFNTPSYWRLRGWSDNGRGLEGLYKTRHGDFWGFIEFRSKTTNEYFIFKPPQQLNSHPKHPCFVHLGNNWYRINFTQHPRSIDDGIAKVESILIEAFERRW
jgi:hypothetical protein